jgi:UDP-glucose 4-epimerase
MIDCLISGGAGFLGSHIADALLADGLSVMVLDDLSGGFRENVPAGATFTESSILNADFIDWLFNCHRFRYVFHCAAYAAEGLSPFIRRFNYTNNVVGSAILINAAIKYDVSCFVFTSSIAVYGAGQTPFTEDMTPAPEDPYGIAKYAVEMDLAAAHRQFGLPYIIFRPHNVYGERQNIHDPYRNVVGIFMRQAIAGEPLTIFGDGSQTRAFSYVDDVAPVIARSVRQPEAFGKVYNIGGDRISNVNGLAAAVQSVMGTDMPINRLPPRKEVLHAFSSHSRVSIFGVEPHTSLTAGLVLMAQWVRANPRGPTPSPSPELLKGLPPSWR